MPISLLAYGEDHLLLDTVLLQKAIDKLNSKDLAVV
jgi:hypothetical protein